MNPLMDQQAQAGQTTPVPTPNFDPQVPTPIQGGMAGGMAANSGTPAIEPPPDAEMEERSAEEEMERKKEQRMESMRDQLAAYLQMTNIAETLKEDVLTRIGQRVVEEYQIDWNSCQDWRDRNKEGIELAQMIGKVKTWGDGIVANVKYPTLAIAAIQFAARAYPNIVNGEDVVKGKKTGVDKDGRKQARADRMATYMSWQLLHQMDAWDEDTDQLLVTLPVVGCAFRKTYRDFINERNVADLVPAQDLVVNYHAKSFEPRCTQHVVLYPNEVIERVRSGKFLDKELGTPVSKTDVVKQHQDSRDESMPHLFLEQHRWEDLDEDGYKEPYAVTVHYDTQQVVRIVARFDLDSIHTNDKGEVYRIEPTQTYTRYLFFPSFDHGFYGMGFGALIGPINKVVNSNLNQLLDAGTMQNRQCGFLGKGIRLPEGTKSVKFKAGEWKYVDNTGDDLRKNIVPLPASAPSDVLYKLLVFMVEAAEKLASNADVLSGNQPQANVPATTTLALIEQGLKVYSSIYLRCHKSLNKEFEKLKYLNKLFGDDEEYQRVLDDPEATIEDFYDKDLDVTPVSDVADLNDMQKVMKAQALRECVGQGLNDREIYRRYFVALNIPDVEAILTVDASQQKTDPKVEVEQLKTQVKQTELALKEKELELKREIEMGKSAKTQADVELQQQKAMTEQTKRELEALRFELEKEKQQLAALQAHSDIVHQGHERAIQTSDTLHQQEMDRREADFRDQELEHRRAELDHKRVETSQQGAIQREQIAAQKESAAAQRKAAANKKPKKNNKKKK